MLNQTLFELLNKYQKINDTTENFNRNRHSEFKKTVNKSFADFQSELKRDSDKNSIQVKRDSDKNSIKVKRDKTNIVLVIIFFFILWLYTTNLIFKNWKKLYVKGNFSWRWLILLLFIFGSPTNLLMIISFLKIIEYNVE